MTMQHKRYIIKVWGIEEPLKKDSVDREDSKRLFSGVYTEIMDLVNSCVYLYALIKYDSDITERTTFYTININ